MKERYQVLKLYCYTHIEDPEALRQAHYRFGIQHDLRGRIKVAKEGINATLSGRYQDCQAYIQYLKRDERLATITLNVMESDGHAHQKLHARLKPEIINTKLYHIAPSRDIAGRCYVTAKEFYTMRHDPNVEVIDMRSNHEHKLGTFENAHTFDMESVREFPKAIEDIAFSKEKSYVLVCTNGPKCEKGRDYLKQVKKLPNVYHLQGGIIRYGQETDGAGFEGVCYVFDERLTLPINHKNPSIISHCHHCAKPSYRMVNCANMSCNLHAPICESCSEKYAGACSIDCQHAAKKRPYDGSGFYAKKVTAA